MQQPGRNVGRRIVEWWSNRSRIIVVNTALRLQRSDIRSLYIALFADKCDKQILKYRGMLYEFCDYAVAKNSSGLYVPCKPSNETEK